jgi:hypothetical protein
MQERHDILPSGHAKVVAMLDGVRAQIPDIELPPSRTLTSGERYMFNFCHSLTSTWRNLQSMQQVSKCANLLE